MNGEFLIEFEREMSEKIQRIAIGLVSLIFVSGGFAASPSELVSRGNEAYESGDFEEAVSQYKTAAVKAPEIAEVAFNLGAAHYRKGEFSDAIDAFKEASVATENPGLSSRAKYNLGNCAYRQAQAAQEEDVDRALVFCESSIRNYRDSYGLDRTFKDAAENMEMARILYRQLLDQKQQEEKEEDEKEDLAEKLKELLERQQKAAADSQQLLETQTDSESWKSGVEHLEQEQQKLAEDTAATLEGIKNLANEDPATGEKLAETSEHVGEALKSQAESLGPLNQKELAQAKPNQQNAAEELKKALEALGDPEQDEQGEESEEQGEESEEQGEESGEQGEESGEQGEESGEQGEESGEQGEESGEQGEESGEQGEESGEQGEESGEQKEGEGEGQKGEEQEQDPAQIQLQIADEEAKDILEKEKQRQMRRVPIRARAGRGVEKDW
ncbi:MAG: Ca-activated chloride channel family protein [Verrucomicrobiales bacterium]